ncbi:MAG: integrase arm-type DNA-binding domain-containing protein [Dinoroseobacter sp.]|nr:integrase arm-type DNA-binding domain-containing protein [Dinoroseobacter sp.]
MRALHKLPGNVVQKVRPGKHSDGGGLWLHQRADGGGQWFLRVSIHGRRREMGLGSTRDVTLKEARTEAERWRAVVRQGLDPIKEREKLKRAAARDQATLESVAVQAFEARKSQLKDDGKAGRWFSPLRLHVLPKLGRVPVEDIDQQDIRNTLAPIWHTKASTAGKAMDRLSIVMKYGAAMGLDVDLQATAKAAALLGKSRHEVQSIPALHWKEVPEFYATLSDGTITQLAIKLTILTALRSRPIRFANLRDMRDDVWTVPAEYMKAQKGYEADFRVPLSTEALAIIEQAKPLARDGLLFPNKRRGVISDATMSRYMERAGMEARPHGFRSSFRTWCAEATDAPENVAETALAHVAGGKVERAYRRTDFLEQRRVLMERWGQYVSGGCGEVVRLLEV